MPNNWKTANPRLDNGDRRSNFEVGAGTVVGLGSFHKTLPCNGEGEVDPVAFKALTDACDGTGEFKDVPPIADPCMPLEAASLVNPQAGKAKDRLTGNPDTYRMPPAPTVRSRTTAAEMTELYWMALLRDVPFNQLADDADTRAAAEEIQRRFLKASALGRDGNCGERLLPGTDVPNGPVTPLNIFRLGLPGEETGPMISQFFIRPVPFGTQTIDTRQRPYRQDRNYLTAYEDWLRAQQAGWDVNGDAYPTANERDATMYEAMPRYISTMRDLARFVNKDALHQAYFNAALLMLSGGAEWTAGNPYNDKDRLKGREAGFGTLGGPHILALVSEVATRALKIVWNQKWQVHLRLRPEAYGGLVHLQNDGVPAGSRAYGLPEWLAVTQAATRVHARYDSYLLPMAFSPGSPVHPAYGAGHAAVAGACVTVLKAYFKLFDAKGTPLLFNTLKERAEPYGTSDGIVAYETGSFDGAWHRRPLNPDVADRLTIEGELNKLAQNVSMGRSMGGVHWRTDNARSLVLGQAIAAEILADISIDLPEQPKFSFRTFERDTGGQPKLVEIQGGLITVNHHTYDIQMERGYLDWHFAEFASDPDPEPTPVAA